MLLSEIFKMTFGIDTTYLRPGRARLRGGLLDLLGDTLLRRGLLDLLLRTGERDLFRDCVLDGEYPLPPRSRSLLRSLERSTLLSSREVAPPPPPPPPMLPLPLLGPPLSGGLSDLPGPAMFLTGELECLLTLLTPKPRDPAPNALENCSFIDP